MNLSPAGAQFIKGDEALRLVAYLDRKSGVWTIGWGHTGPDVYEGLVCTAKQAQTWFDKDTSAAVAAVNDAVKATALAQPQFDALVSLAFNIGASAFRTSTLVRKLNAGDVQGAADEFLRWNRDQDEHGQLVEVAGLTARRKRERALFLEGVSAAPAPAPAPAPIVESQPDVVVPEKPSMASNPPKPIISPTTMAIGTAVNPWLGMGMSILNSMWPEVAKATTSEVGQRNVKLAEDVMTAVQQATGTSTPQAAIEAIQADPVVASDARASANKMLDAWGLLGVDLAGVEKAREFATVMSANPNALKTPIFILSLLVLLMIGGILMTVMVVPLVMMAYKVDASVIAAYMSAETRSMIVGSFMGLAAGAFFGFWYGANQRDARKDELIASK